VAVVAPGRAPQASLYHLRVGISSPSGLVIAIDGPSGSGKSSASKGVARALGLRYLDTGAMYRALTWWFMAEEADTADTAQVAARAAEPVIDVSTDPDDPWTRVNGRDVTRDIRTPEVSAQVSEVARVPAVREHLIARQRAIIAAAGPGIVAEGRDIGTVVAKDAQLKVFLTADPGARARRRAAELRADAVETEAAQARRDRLDAAQSEKAADALLLDATDLTLDQVIGEIARLARERGRGLLPLQGPELVGCSAHRHKEEGFKARAGENSG
jgi:CMP/dCMP kinase